MLPPWPRHQKKNRGRGTSKKTGYNTVFGKPGGGHTRGEKYLKRVDFTPPGSNRRGPSGLDFLVTTAVVTTNLNRPGPTLGQFLVTAAAVTRNVNRLGPSWLQFLVTTAVVTRNLNRLGPTLRQFLVTAAAVTRNVN